MPKDKLKNMRHEDTKFDVILHFRREKIHGKTVQFYLIYILTKFTINSTIMIRCGVQRRISNHLNRIVFLNNDLNIKNKISKF